MTNILDPEKLVQAIEGPRISVPFILIHNLHGDFQAAAFLAQAAYFSALSRKKDGWFDLRSTGGLNQIHRIYSQQQGAGKHCSG
jgi:hypothetical protein